MQYEHREFRVKRDGGSIRIGRRRFRPGELVDVEVPEELRGMCDPVARAHAALTPPKDKQAKE